MPTCTFPNCPSNSLRGSDYCIPHGKIYGVKVEKKPQSIAKQSEKRIKESKEYRKIVKEILSKDGRCSVKSPVCTKKATGLHHLQKRSPANYKERSNLIASCNECNLYIEEHPCWAKEKGLTVSRFKK